MAIKLCWMIIACACRITISILTVINETNFSDGLRSPALRILWITCTSSLPESFDEEIVLKSQSKDEKCEPHATKAGIGDICVGQAKT